MSYPGGKQQQTPLVHQGAYHRYSQQPNYAYDKSDVVPGSGVIQDGGRHSLAHYGRYPTPGYYIAPGPDGQHQPAYPHPSLVIHGQPSGPYQAPPPQRTADMSKAALDLAGAGGGAAAAQFQPLRPPMTSAAAVMAAAGYGGPPHGRAPPSVAHQGGGRAGGAGGGSAVSVAQHQQYQQQHAAAVAQHQHAAAVAQHHAAAAQAAQHHAAAQAAQPQHVHGTNVSMPPPLSTAPQNYAVQPNPQSHPSAYVLMMPSAASSGGAPPVAPAAMGANPQYALPSPYPQVAQPYITQPQGMYQPPPGWQATTQPTQPMYQLRQPTPVVRPQPGGFPKRSKAIEIVDPDTMKALDLKKAREQRDAEETSPQDGAAQAVAQQFAAQVAARLATAPTRSSHSSSSAAASAPAGDATGPSAPLGSAASGSRSRTSSETTPPAPHTPTSMPPPQMVAAGVLPPPHHLASAPPHPVSIQQLVQPPLLQTPTAGAVPVAMAHPAAAPSSHRHNGLAANVGSPPQEAAVLEAKPSVVHPPTAAAVTSSHKPTTGLSTQQTPVVVVVAKSSDGSASTTPSTDEAPSVMDVGETATSSLEVSSATATISSTAASAAAHVSGQKEASVTTSSAATATTSEGRVASSTSSAAAPSVLSQQNKKKGGKQKMRDLNRRAESRQMGGDMDAFTGTSPAAAVEVNSRSSTPLSAPATSAAADVQVVKTPSPVEAATTATVPPPPAVVAESTEVVVVDAVDDVKPQKVIQQSAVSESAVAPPVVEKVQPVVLPPTVVVVDADCVESSPVPAVVDPAPAAVSATAVVEEDVPAAADVVADDLEEGEIRDDADEELEAADHQPPTVNGSRDLSTPTPAAPMTELERIIADILSVGGSKKSYNRDDLMKLQQHPLAKRRPVRLADLPNVVLKDPRNVAARSRSMGPMVGLLDMGSRSHGGGGGGGGKYGGRNSQRGRRDVGPMQPQMVAPQPRRLEISLNRDVKLSSSDNAWKAGHSKKVKDEELDETELLIKAIKGKLNKITPSNLGKLVDEIKLIKIGTKEQLTKVIDVLFDKAVDEPSYAELYAKVCLAISKTEVEETEVDGKKVTFRKILLTKCQTEFEKDKSLELNKEERQSEIDKETDEQEKKKKKFFLNEEARKMRLRSNGNIRFIGELYKLEMLTHRIMHQCIVKLIKDKHEDSYECLCKLLSTIGDKLEKSEETRGKSLNQQFEDVRKLSKDNSISSRIRFMMEDLMEMRANGWVSKRVGDTAKPMTIQEVHEQARQDEVNQRQRLAQVEERRHMGGRGSMGGGGPDRRRGGGMGGGGSRSSMGGGSEWSQAPSRRFDTNRLMSAASSRPGGGGMPKMGPAGPGGAWSFGSKGGLSAGSRASPAQDVRNSPFVTSSSNRFGALSTGDDNDVSPGPAALASGSRCVTPVKSMGGITAAGRLASAGRRPASSERAAVTGSQPSVASRELKGSADITIQRMGNKVVSIIDELLEHGNMDMGVTGCKEELHESTMVMFVAECVNKLIDARSTKQRHAAGELHRQLLQRQLLTAKQYLQAMTETLEYMPDMACDIPTIWTNLAELLAPPLQPIADSDKLMATTATPIITLTQLAEPATPVKQAGCGPQMLVALLKRLMDLMGAARVRALVPATFNWQLYFNNGQDHLLPLNNAQLGFLVPGESEPLAASSAPAVPARLRQLVDATRQRPAEQLQAWLTSNGHQLPSPAVNGASPPPSVADSELATDLLSALCFDSILREDGMQTVSSDRLERHSALLKSVITCVEAEVAALNGLTTLISHLQYPPNVLDRWFRLLYDMEVISERGFVGWRDDRAVSTEGKGVAVISVQNFFGQLLTPDDEERAPVSTAA